MRTSINPLLLWGKRLLIYILGVFLMAIAAVLSARSSLGVGPVNSLGNVLYQVGRAAGAPAYINLGNCTTAVFCLYMFTEYILLLREFRPAMLLQIVASLLFGQFVNLASLMLAGLPSPDNYAMQMLYLLVSIPFVSGGIMFYLAPNLIAMPSGGLCLALSRRSGLHLGTIKTIFDCAVVLLSVAVSLLHFKTLVGVREGTVISALLVGTVLRLLQKCFQKPLLRFVERDQEQRASENAAT